MAVDSISIRAGNGIFAAQLNKIIFKFFENDSPILSTAIFISKRMTDYRIVQLEGLVGGIVEGIVVVFRAHGYRTAIGDGVGGIIQQGGASNDNRGCGMGNFITAGDGDLVVEECGLLPGSEGSFRLRGTTVLPFKFKAIISVFIYNVTFDCRAS